MTLDDFKRLVSETEVPVGGFHLLLRALWQDARGDWQGAHWTAQEDPTSEGAWVHAYLHRKEGDAGNARYWYDRAGRPFCRSGFDQEWEEIALHLLGK